MKSEPVDAARDAARAALDLLLADPFWREVGKQCRIELAARDNTAQLAGALASLGLTMLLGTDTASEVMLHVAKTANARIRTSEVKS